MTSSAALVGGSTKIKKDIEKDFYERFSEITVSEPLELLAPSDKSLRNDFKIARRIYSIDIQTRKKIVTEDLLRRIGFTEKMIHSCRLRAQGGLAESESDSRAMRREMITIYIKECKRHFCTRCYDIDHTCACRRNRFT